MEGSEMQNRRIAIQDMLRVLFKRELYLDMVVFIFLCIPAVLAILFFSIKLDRLFGLKFFIGSPYNIILFIIFFSSGGIIVWWAYAYLVVVGEGSPCPQLGGTKKLVTSGPYALVRHPSVIGKLMGVIGLGCIFKATSFTFVIIPVLFLWSVFYNRFIQERGCVEKFKEEYIAYRKAVPMFIPKLKS
jgi:protein-S-isoprenylcysteine O-methyltransferase Ste14